MTLTELAKQVKARYDKVEPRMDVHVEVSIQGRQLNPDSQKYIYEGPAYFLLSTHVKTPRGKAFMQKQLQKAGWSSPTALLKWLDDTIAKLDNPTIDKDPLSPDIELL